MSLLDKTLYPDDPVKKEEIYNKYKEYLTAVSSFNIILIFFNFEINYFNYCIINIIIILIYIPSIHEVKLNGMV